MMSETGPVLLLTRPRRSSETFKSKLEVKLGRQVDTVISPIIRILDYGPFPDLDAYATVILTSQHAVERLGVAGSLVSRSVVTVGEETAAYARSFSANAVALGVNAEDFLRSASGIRPPCLHCRGLHTRGCIAERLSKDGIQTEDAIIYDQRSVPLSEEAKQILKGGLKVVAPVFSPRSAELLAREVPEGVNLEIVAISEASASAWTGPGQIFVAREPNLNSMLRSVAGIL